MHCPLPAYLHTWLPPVPPIWHRLNVLKIPIMKRLITNKFEIKISRFTHPNTVQDDLELNFTVKRGKLYAHVFYLTVCPFLEPYILVSVVPAPRVPMATNNLNISGGQDKVDNTNKLQNIGAGADEDEKRCTSLPTSLGKTHKLLNP